MAHLKAVSLRPASLDPPVGDTEKTNLGIFSGTNPQQHGSTDLQTKSRFNVIKQLMPKLNERDALSSPCVLNSGRGSQNTRRGGVFFGIIRERVRQIQNAILKESRDVVTDEDRQLTSDEVDEEGF